MPNGQGSFDDRVATLTRDVSQAAVPWLQAVLQTRIDSRDALQQKLSQIVDGGGEGLMLHRADAVWQSGRSDVLLKLKPQQDAEARVIAYENGQGKYEGMIGALIVMAPDGRRLRLGTGLTMRCAAILPRSARPFRIAIAV